MGIEKRNKSPCTIACDLFQFKKTPLRVEQSFVRSGEAFSFYLLFNRISSSCNYFFHKRHFFPTNDIRYTYISFTTLPLERFECHGHCHSHPRRQQNNLHSAELLFAQISNPEINPHKKYQNHHRHPIHRKNLQADITYGF